MGEVDVDPVVSGIRKIVGNLISSNVKGKRGIRKYNPKQPSSARPQSEVQLALHVVTEIWKVLPEIMKKSWDTSIVRKYMTSYNLFMSENVLKQKDGGIVQLSCCSGIENLSGYVVKPGKAGEIIVKFNPVTESVNLTVAIQRIIGGVGDSILEIRKDILVSSPTVTLNGFESGQEYFVYCMTTDKPFDEATMISESSGFRVMVR